MTASRKRPAWAGTTHLGRRPSKAFGRKTGHQVRRPAPANPYDGARSRREMIIENRNRAGNPMPRPAKKGGDAAAGAVFNFGHARFFSCRSDQRFIEWVHDRTNHEASLVPRYLRALAGRRRGGLFPCSSGRRRPARPRRSVLPVRWRWGRPAACKWVEKPIREAWRSTIVKSRSPSTMGPPRKPA
jgi:hypothetical protein